jgi:hypothetical protein
MDVAGGRTIGQMQTEEFMGFEVNEPGGGNTGAGKKLWLA